VAFSALVLGAPHLSGAPAGPVAPPATSTNLTASRSVTLITGYRVVVCGDSYETVSIVRARGTMRFSMQRTPGKV
jgi:hypothetical protein